MKIERNEKYNTIAAYVCVVVLIGSVIVWAVFNFSGLMGAMGDFFDIINPFLWGIAIAYALHRPVNFFEKRVFAFLGKVGKKHKLPRICAMLLIYSVTLAGVVALLIVIIPELASSVSTFVENLGTYINDLNDWWNGVLRDLSIPESMGADFSIETIIVGVVNYIKDVAPVLANAGINLISQIISSIGNIVVAIVSSVYLLFSKDNFIMQFKKLAFAVFPKTFTEKSIALTRQSNKIFSSYITSKLVESLIMGALHFFAMSIFDIPYAFLVGTIMGMTEILPFFGPYVGAIPSAFLLFLVEPKYALWFIGITLVLQQLDAQIIAPRLLGESTGLTAFWVIFAIILGGGLFGLPGMILGIPLFAVVYAVVGEYINSRLEKKGLSTDPIDYHTENP